MTKALRGPPFLLLLPSLPLVSGTCWGKNICAVALLSARVCHPFAGAMLIFSVSFQFYLVPSRRRAKGKERAKRPKGPEERASVHVLCIISPNSGIFGPVGFSDALRGVPGRLGHLTGRERLLKGARCARGVVEGCLLPPKRFGTVQRYQRQDWVLRRSKRHKHHFFVELHQRREAPLLDDSSPCPTRPPSSRRRTSSWCESPLCFSKMALAVRKLGIPLCESVHRCIEKT